LPSILENGYLDWQTYAVSLIKDQIADVLVLPGGFGSGKTALNVHIIRSLIEQRELTGLLIAATYGMIKDTVAITIDEEIPEQYIKQKTLGPHFEWKFKAPNGNISKLISRTAKYGHEVGVRIKSINADFLWLVEATELPKEAYTYGISRRRKSGEGAYYPILIETNPKSKSNWVYILFIEKSKLIYTSPCGQWWVLFKKYEHKDDKGKIHRKKVYIIKTTTYANPHFPRSTIVDMLESYSPAEVQRLIYGEWNALEGRVWSDYEIFKHPTDLKKYAEKYDHITVGVDPGGTTAITFLGLAGNQWEIFDEINVDDDKTSIEECLDLIKERCETWGITRRFDVYTDPSAKYWKNEFNSIANNPYKAWQSKHKGTDPALNRAKHLNEFFRTKRLKISTLCLNCLKDVEQAVYTGEDKSKVDKTAYDPHFMDSVGYAMQKEAW